SHGELSRFDGSSFKHYYPDKNKAGYLRNDHCVAMVEDSLHNLWIGTFSGLSRYDIKAGTFTNFPIHINSITSDESVVPFWTAQNEVFCLEAGNQITSYDIHSFKRKKLVDIRESDKADLGLLKSSHAIFEAQSNSIWMLPQGEEGLVQFSLSTGKISFHKQNLYSGKPDAWGHTDAEAMCFDRKRNCIWINSHDGLTQFTLSDQKFHHIEELNPFIRTKGYARMVGIDIDMRGRIWLATIPNGILIYNPSTNFVTKLFPDSAMQHEIGDGNLKIYCDRDGIVWTSYFVFKEIYQLIPHSPSAKSFTANHYKPDSLISLDIGNMVAGEHGELWIGTAYGLNIYNPIKETFKVLAKKDMPGIKGIFPLAIDTLRKKAWICTSPPDIVYEMNLQNKKCKLVIFKDTLGRTMPPVHIISKVSNLYKNGCLFYDAGYGIFEEQGDSAVARLIIPFQQEIYKAILAEDRILFLKTFLGNLTYYNYGGRWLKKTKLLDSIDWDDIFYDSLNKTYWAAVEGKIIHYDKNFRIISSYTNGNELMRGILNILPDKYGNIWFNNDRKMVGNLHIKTGIITMLSEQDGYQKQWYDIYSPIPAKAGSNLYFVGNSLAPEVNLVEINPGKLNSYPAVTVYFRSLEIRDFSSSLSADINDIKKLSLKYFQNTINIETGVIDYYSKGKNYIRYKLEVGGKAAGWQYIPLKSIIHYEGLLPGNYKLIIQGSNTANEFNGPEKILLININAAFWNTWWFRLIIIGVAAFIIVNIFRQRIKKIRHDAFIKNQLKDLEMKALKAQMNPHFIYNALNSIQSLVANDKKTEGIHYIGSFSRLLRQVLDNSENNVISL
ncbi:MAG: histidine kinase, partial [Bacteroidota bacterium]|nr:histidine kinase [Bacteroidota bacterium]